MYEPLYRSRPAHRWTFGDLACNVGADLGLPPDDEQQWILDTMYAEKAPGVPASFEVCTISARQNIKTSTAGIGALADLFVFGVEKHVWTAHHGDTLKDTFRDFRSWLKSNREYEDQVQFYEGHQDMSIVRTDPETRQAYTLEFQSRSGKAGRGFTGVKRITVDEALYLEAKHVGAIYPTRLTQSDAQVRILSSGGLVTSVELRRVRDRGRRGKDNRLAYVEYGAKRRPCLRADCTHKYGEVEGCALDDRELWWEANCALWSGRVLEESIADLRKSMPPDEFAREMLTWWEDPLSVGGAMSGSAWGALADPDAQRGERVVFGLHVDEDRTAWIAVAWEREDGHKHVMLARGGSSLPAYEVSAECARLTSEWSGPIVPPRALEDELTMAQAQVAPMPAGEWVTACGSFFDEYEAGTLHHGNQPALNAAVDAAKWRSAGATGERAFQINGIAESGPIAAAIRALYGLMHMPSLFFGAWR